MAAVIPLAKQWVLIGRSIKKGGGESYFRVKGSKFSLVHFYAAHFTYYSGAISLLRITPTSSTSSSSGRGSSSVCAGAWTNYITIIENNITFQQFKRE